MVMTMTTMNRGPKNGTTAATSQKIFSLTKADQAVIV